jgi:hypothetical protein
MGHDDLALLGHESFEGGHGGFGIEAAHFGLDEPSDQPGGRRLAASPPPGDLGGLECAIANQAVEPGDNILRRPPLADELQERVLDGVLGRVAFLPRVQHQRCGMGVHQLCEV